MPENENINGFVPFLCSHCHQEIEASADMVGQTVECPACGEKLTVPAADAKPEVLEEAIKSRTIRIELDSI